MRGIDTQKKELGQSTFSPPPNLQVEGRPQFMAPYSTAKTVLKNLVFSSLQKQRTKFGTITAAKKQGRKSHKEGSQREEAPYSVYTQYSNFWLTSEPCMCRLNVKTNQKSRQIEWMSDLLQFEFSQLNCLIH